MQPSFYGDNIITLEVWKLSDELIELIGDRAAIVGYEFEPSDTNWGLSENMVFTLFAKTGEEWEDLDHLLEDAEILELEEIIWNEINKEGI